VATVSHPAAAAPAQRPRVLVVGTMFALGGIAMLFAGLIGIYLAMRSGVVSAGDTWLPEGVSIPLTQPNSNMFNLILGAVTAQWAVYAIARDDRINAYLALGLTFVFGFMFIITQSYLWSIMQLDITGSPQAVLLYTIGGAHMAFLVGTMIFLVLMAIRALGGQFTSRQHDGISSAALSWHVMTAVYFVIWIAVYITK
jgi:cytochrome c oxidase subunit 3